MHHLPLPLPLPACCLQMTRLCLMTWRWATRLSSFHTSSPTLRCTWLMTLGVWCVVGGGMQGEQQLATAAASAHAVLVLQDPRSAC